MQSVSMQPNPVNVTCIASIEWLNKLQDTRVTSLALEFDQDELVARSIAAFDRLLYKGNNQHRNSVLYRKLKQLQTLLHNIHRLDIGRSLGSIVDPLKAALSNSGRDGSTRCELPTREIAASELYKLLRLCNIIETVSVLVLDIGLLLQSEISQSFFMTMNLTLLGLLSQLQVSLPSQILLPSIQAYNNLYDAALILPSNPNTISPSAALRINALPQMIKCQWVDKKPVLQAIPQEDDVSLMSASRTKVSGLRTLTLAAIEADEIPLGCNVLDVIEDKGIPVVFDASMADVEVEQTVKDQAQPKKAVSQKQPKNSKQKKAAPAYRVAEPVTKKPKPSSTDDDKDKSKGWEAWLS